MTANQTTAANVLMSPRRQTARSDSCAMNHGFSRKKADLPPSQMP